MKTAKDLLNEKETQPIYVNPDATIHEALLKMSANKIGAMLIEDETGVIGIYTERDLLKNSAMEGFNPKSAIISDYMSKGLVKVPHNCSIYRMMDIFLGKRIRHLLVEENGEFVGLLSTGDVVKANLMEKSQEVEELNKIVNFDYYSNWQWKKKK